MAETENHIKIERGDVIFVREVVYWRAGTTVNAYRARVDSIKQIKGGVELHYGRERKVDEIPVSNTMGTRGYISDDKAVVPMKRTFNGEWNVKRDIFLKPLVRRGKKNPNTRWGHNY